MQENITIVGLVFPWISTILSLWGTHLNSHHDRRGFYVWLVANVCYTAWFTYLQMWPTAILFAVFCYYNIVGLRTWSKK